MSGKKKAVYLICFIIVMFAIITAIVIAEHLPIVGKPIVFISAMILVVFVIVFCVIAVRRQSK